VTASTRRQAALVGRLARAYARVLGVRAVERDGLHVCAGLPDRSYPRGGVTWGDTYLTGAGSHAVSVERLRHERVHVEQWRRHGLPFALLYLLAGRDATRNRFEVEAGLADGGYADPGQGKGRG
jgi:hypothetical protein